MLNKATISKPKSPVKSVTRALARRVLRVVDCGLVRGQGWPMPGEMCVEAAVSYAMGLPHGDEPACVAPAVRELKIALNDQSWSSPSARARGLRRLAIAQLGSAGVLDECDFAHRVSVIAIRQVVPAALRAAASIQALAGHKPTLLEAANRCELDGTSEAAMAASGAADAAAGHARRARLTAVTYVASEAACAARVAALADAAAKARFTIAIALVAARAANVAGFAASAAAAAANACDAAGDGAKAANARDEALAEFAEAVVKVLMEMDAPGCRFLDLTEDREGTDA